MALFSKSQQPKTPKQPKQKSPKYPFQYSAFIVDHPSFDTDMDGIRIMRSVKLPKEAILTEGDKIRPILIYRPEYKGETLIPVPESGETKAMIKNKIDKRLGIFPRSTGFYFTKGWYFLTPRYIYTDPDSGVTLPKDDVKKSRKNESVEDFINSIAAGETWDSITDMGPYQLGQDLELSEMDRLQAHIKARRGIRNNMYGFIKTFTWWALAALTILGIIMMSQGG